MRISNVSLLFFVFSSSLYAEESGTTQERATIARSTSIRRIPLKPLYAFPGDSVESNKDIAKVKNVCHKPMPEWLVQSSLKNAPPLLRGITNYLLGRSHGKVIPSFHRFILVGPPGTGKTTLARAVGHSLHGSTILVSATDFLGPYRNDTPIKLRFFFETFYTPPSEDQKPTVIIIDELHKLFEGYENNNCDKSETAAAFWLALDTLEMNNPHVIVIGTANSVTKLPPEIKSRFHGKIITMPLPTKKQKIQAFRNILIRDESVVLDASIDDVFIDNVVTLLEEGSLRDIQLLIDASKMFYYMYSSSPGVTTIKLHRSHFEQALKQLNGETTEHIEGFMQRIYPKLKPYALVLGLAINVLTGARISADLAKEAKRYFARA